MKLTFWNQLCNFPLLSLYSIFGLYFSKINVNIPELRLLRVSECSQIILNRLIGNHIVYWRHVNASNWKPRFFVHKDWFKVCLPIYKVVVLGKTIKMPEEIKLVPLKTYSQERCSCPGHLKCRAPDWRAKSSQHWGPNMKPEPGVVRKVVWGRGCRKQG